MRSCEAGVRLVCGTACKGGRPRGRVRMLAWLLAGGGGCTGRAHSLALHISY